MVADNIYLYHLDAELQKLYIRGNYTQLQLTNIQHHFSNIVRLAFLLCNTRLFVPLSNYLESGLAYNILNGLFSEMNPEDNPLVLLSTAPNLQTALLKKKIEHQEQYLENPHFRYNEFEQTGFILPGKFKTRSRSASKDIERDLIISIADEGFWVPFKQFVVPTISFEQMQYQLAEIPQRLSGQAYISDYVLPHLSVDEQMTTYADRQMNMNITRWYLKSFLTELDAVCLTDIRYIAESEILPDIPEKKHLSYSNYFKLLRQRTVPLKKGFTKTNVNAFDFISTCSPEMLIEFKHSQLWADVCLEKTTQIPKIYALGELSMMYADVKTGIVTALPKEFAAIKVLLNNVLEVSFPNEEATAGNRYYVGEIENRNGAIHKIALCLLPKYGNNFASIISTKMMTHFKNIKNLIICGIAGGVPSEVRLGDVVVSTNGVIQYDFGSDKPDNFIPKSNPKDCSDFLLEAVQLLRAEEDERGCTWLKYVDEIEKRASADFSRPKIILEKYEGRVGDEYDTIERDVAARTATHFGTIGSGNAVQKNAKKRDALNSQHGVIAVEMEASGISDATHLENNGYIAIRGICDYCDLHKNDEWQYYAAAVAAAYTYALIESVPVF